AAPTAPAPATTAAARPPTPTGAPSAAPPGLAHATVTRVIDGDTIEVSLGGATRAVRLILVDTPEIGGPVECFGAEARDFVRALLPAGTPVALERDVSDVDRYGRLLRYVHLADGRLLNEVLLAEGYARLATFPPDVARVERFRVAEVAARAAGRGLWAACAAHSPAPAAPAPAGAPSAGTPAIISLTSPVSPRGTARLAARTTPSASCAIRYVTPAGTVSDAQGLVAKVADAAGDVGWSWTIGSATRPGTGTVTVTCAGASASAPIEIR
ncbi:MAG: hypothetical protein FJZ92_09880, partial [Chloroflexi bacterium]|nr:hypothetical protein [Chloroflexota bacterium]